MLSPYYSVYHSCSCIDNLSYFPECFPRWCVTLLTVTHKLFLAPSLSLTREVPWLYLSVRISLGAVLNSFAVLLTKGTAVAVLDITSLRPWCRVCAHRWAWHILLFFCLDFTITNPKQKGQIRPNNRLTQRQGRQREAKIAVGQWGLATVLVGMCLRKGVGCCFYPWRAEVSSPLRSCLCPCIPEWSRFPCS